jgi:hypothetical protein
MIWVGVGGPWPVGREREDFLFFNLCLLWMLVIPLYFSKPLITKTFSQSLLTDHRPTATAGNNI